MKFRLLTLLFVFAALSSFAQLKQKNFDQRSTTGKFTTLMQLLTYYYVEDVDQPKLTEEAIIAVLKELDPHSVYIPKEEVQKTNEPLVGNFEGVGIQFQIYKDTILVISPVPGGPSEKMGIRAGDKIIKINDESAYGKKVNTQYVFDRLRGPKGTSVALSIYRKGQKNLLDYTVVRDKIPLNSIDASYMLTKDIGYIKLSRFARTSSDEFVESVQQLKQQGMQSLIFDLRNNSGGYLDIAFEMADQFLPLGKIIVYTEGLKSPKQEFVATQGGMFEKGKLIVLIDEGSASASEIVAGAVQDWDRGIIMGRRSFGKGLVQRPFLLPDSSMVRLTTSKYYTPSGRCIQKPYEGGEEAYRSEIFERMKHGEMLHADSIRFPDSLRYFTNSKRVVYGGGGIMPDYFIPIDTTFASDYYTTAIRKGLVNDFTLQYVESNRNTMLKKYPDIKSFLLGFKDDDFLLNQFVDFAETKELKRDNNGLEASGTFIKNLLKALIARNLFNTNAYFQVIAATDDDLLKAIEIIKDDNQFIKFSH